MTRRPARLLLAVVAAGLVATPGATTATAASWTDRTRVTALVTVASAACTTTGLFLTSASAAQLAGTVQGTAIGASTAFAPASTGVRSDALTRSSPLAVADVGTTPTVAGVALPLQLTAGASWAQTATTSGTGTASATAGGGSAFGAVGVSDLLARPPSAAARLPGLSGVALDVGRIDATARLDGCGAAFAAATPLTRTSAVGALGLRFVDSAAADDLVAIRANAATAASGVGAQAASAAPQIGTAAGTALLGAVAQALTALGAAGASAAATPSPAAVTALVVPAVATAPASQTAPLLRLDTATGEAALDLTAAAVGQNADVVTTARAAAGAASLAAALTQQAGAASAGVTAARDATSVAVRSSVDVAITVLGVTTTICTISIDQTAAASAWAAGTVPVAPVTLTPRGGVPITGLADAVTARLPQLLQPAVQGAVSSAFVTPTTTAIASAAGTTADRLAADGPARAAHLAAVPSSLQVTADLRPAGAADDWTGAAGAGRLTALRVRVLDGTGARADLFIGDARVGPATPAHP